MVASIWEPEDMAFIYGFLRLVTGKARACLLAVVLLCLLTSPHVPTAFAEPGLDSFPGWDGSATILGRAGPTVPHIPEPAFTKLPAFTRPVLLRSIPGTEPERLVILELAGRAHSFVNTPDVSGRAPFLDVGPAKRGRNDKKAYSLLFALDYPKDPSLYLLYNKGYTGTCTNILSRFTVQPGDETTAPRVDPNSEQQLLRWWSFGHDGGDLAWGPDEMLYVSTGDGSKPNDPMNLGQTTDNLLGSILRLDPTGPALVPTDNPFINQSGVRPEVWAYGLRNPWRMSFDPHGNLWVGDNGNELWEMVHRSRKGANHGWSTFEGNHPYRPRNPLAGPTRVRAPVAVEHPHTEMRSLIGGITCRDPDLPALKGRTLYGDYVTGKVWSFRWDAKRNEVVERRPEADTRSQILAFCEDRAGHLYIVSNSGPIFRLRPAPDDERAPFPERLSATGLFADTAAHQLAPGVLPYEVNHPQWSDGNRASRAVAMPGGTERPGGPAPAPMILRPRPLVSFELPSGSAVIQTFADPASGRRIETQLALNDAEVWHFFTYAWDEEQTDAELVPPEGFTRHGRRFMGRSECTICHTASSSFLLSFSPEQLNRDFDYTALGGRSGNQLDTLTALGRIPKHVERRLDDKTAFPAVDDQQASVAERARTWLHVNCAHCHREGGAGGRATFQLMKQLSDQATGCLDALPLLDLWNTKEGRLVAPGDPDRSLLLKRISVRGAGQMPLLGSTKVDQAGIALVRAWIEELK